MVGLQPHTGDRAPRRGVSPPRSPVRFAEESLRPTPGASEIVSFGAEEGDDLDKAMSLTASKKDWAQASEERSEVEGHAAFQDEPVRILTRAVSDLGLEWEKADEPARSKLDSWYLDSGRRVAALRKRGPFLPDLHDDVAKARAAPQSARTHAGGSEIFTKVDGAEARGYTRVPPVEESIAAHLCPHSIRGSRSPLIGDARPLLSHSAPVCPVNSLSVSSTYGGVAQNTEAGAPRPLSHFTSAGISEWIRNVVENSYTLQFQRRPPRFNGNFHSGRH
ncbi:kinase C alpha type-like protein [Labeo rohita]|uniref:Kinase C alpha type-like protein n=1 Tax=Labeo rohita TaxID=84645 RepID=A0A498NY73_LABRO|nr:kinase C alpha type-like protein [Labeo rohita]